MATKKKTPAAKPKAKSTRKAAGATRRATQKRVGKPAPIFLVEDLSGLTTPAKAEAWLYDFGRSALGLGHGVRADPARNAEAFKPIETLCHKYAAPLKERALPPVLVSGAALLTKRLLAAIAEPEPVAEGAPVSLLVKNAAALVTRRRGMVIRLLPGSDNANLRAAFGIDEAFNTSSPAAVIAASQALIKGKRKYPDTAAAQRINEGDLKALAANIAALQSEVTKAKAVRGEGKTQTTNLDILNAGLEAFFDRYVTSIELVLEDDPIAVIAAQELVPRRTERRGRKAAAPGTTTTAAPAKTLP